MKNKTKMTHKRKNKIEYGKTTIAITQILILVIATIAFSWMIGGEVKEVSADVSDETPCPNFCGGEGSKSIYGGKRDVASNNVCVIDVLNFKKYCPDGCAFGVCKLSSSSEEETTTTTTTFNSCSGIKSCGFDNNVYDSKLVAGNCMADYDKLIEKCDYGCDFGGCKMKGQSGIGNTVTSMGSTILGAVATNYATHLLIGGGSAGAGGAVAGGTVAGEFVPGAVTTIVTGGTPGTLGASLFGTTTTTTTAGATATAASTTTTAWSGVGGGTIAGGGSVIGAVGAIVVWSAVAFLVGRYVGPMLGLNTQQSQALGYSLAAGTAAGLILTSDLLMGIIGASGAGGPIGIVAGVVVAFVMFAILAKKSSMDVIQYTCSQWDSQSGRGLTEAQKIERCKMCNNQKDLVCTEYQCKSLGQGCTLINEESSGKQLCIWNNTRDINPPIMTPWEEALLDDFKYTPDNTVSPPDKGVKISYTGTEKVTMDGTTRCAPAFTPISFGVKLDEPAKCKINPLKLSSYGEMADVFMGRGIRDYNQSFVLTLPSKEAMEAENITVENGGKYELYVRCEDANGNANIGNFVFKFCINQGPDTTSPLILGSSILDKQPIAYGQKSVDLDLYVRDQTFTNKNASCRWSHLDKSYSAMEENMSCTHSLLNINSQLIYSCSASLTGLKDNQDNKFYFRCADDLGNANRESYSLTLIGTQPLVIESVGPKGIIEDSTNVIKINLTAQTAAGHDEGKAICSFSETGSSGSYVDFFYGYDAEPFSQYRHSQELWLEEGNYTYFIQCRDKGGNIDNKNVSFSIETDLSSPIVVRVYKEDDYLKLITDEPGKCVYFPNGGCTYLFDEGTLMTSLEEKEYYAEWNIKNDLYIKCKDEYGNMPSPDECSIIARPFEIFELQ